jgi:hypothetical protein
MNKPEKHKLDLFKVLANIDLKKHNFFSTLTDEEKKSVSPYVLMRWLSGTTSARQIYFLNEFVNPYAFTLQKEKDLLLKLMMICTSGKKQRYQWIKLPKKQKTQSKLVALVKEYFGYNQKHATEALPLLSNDDLLSYATQLGYQPKEITELNKELKKRD